MLRGVLILRCLSAQRIICLIVVSDDCTLNSFTRSNLYSFTVMFCPIRFLEFLETIIWFCSYLFLSSPIRWTDFSVEKNISLSSLSVWESVSLSPAKANINNVPSVQVEEQWGNRIESPCLRPGYISNAPSEPFWGIIQTLARQIDQLMWNSHFHHVRPQDFSIDWVVRLLAIQENMVDIFSILRAFCHDLSHGLYFVNCRSSRPKTTLIVHQDFFTIMR